MPVIWLNATVGAGKTAVGLALAATLPAAKFIDGDDHAGPAHLPNPLRWRMALQALLRAVSRGGHHPALVIAYPLDPTGYRQLKATCSRAHRTLIIVNLATPLAIILRGRGHRRLDAAEQARMRTMRSKAYHRRRFATATLPNAHPPASRTAKQIVHLVHQHTAITTRR